MAYVVLFVNYSLKQVAGVIRRYVNHGPALHCAIKPECQHSKRVFSIPRERYLIAIAFRFELSCYPFTGFYPYPPSIRSYLLVIR